jgi:hypothetical protein
MLHLFNPYYRYSRRYRPDPVVAVMTFTDTPSSLNGS